MISNHEHTRATVAEQAGEWFVAHDDGGLDAQASAALVAWLKASPTHVEEFLRVAVIARDLRVAGADPEYSAETLVARARAEDEQAVRPFWLRVLTAVREAPLLRWQSAAAMVVAAGVATLGFLLWRNLRPLEHVSTSASAPTLRFETRHGEQQTRRLADGSVLHLNTDSSVTVRYTQAERLLMLTAGEADFEVAHTPNRPFRVVARPLEVIARGTQFDVRLGNNSTVVTVVAGRVTVEPAAPAEGFSSGSNRSQPSRSVEVGANQQITVSTGEWPVVPVDADAERSTSWLHRQIAFKHEPLERVAAEFNRYAPKPIEIATPELRKLEISGVFATDDPAAFIAFLRSLEGVRVDETATRIRVSKK